MINPIDITQQFHIYNGRIVPVSQFDNSRLIGEKVLYEVIRIVDSSPVFWNYHIERFRRSAELSGLPFPSANGLTAQVKALLAQNPVSEKNIRLALVYGSNKNTPTFLAYFIKSSYPAKELYEQGVRVELLWAERPNPLVKAENHTLREAADAIIANGAYEALLVNGQNEITEGSRSNFFAVKDGCLFTSPLGAVLEGITRKVVLQICRENSIKVVERSIAVDDLDGYTSVFLTGTSPKILPIAQIGTKRYEPQSDIVTHIQHLFYAKERESILEWFAALNSTPA